MPGAEGGEVVRFTLLSLPSRNSSNKCTFHTKVSLFILLLSLDPSLVDCKFKVCVIPQAILLQMPSSEDGLKLGSLSTVCVAAAHVPLPIVKLSSIYFCLYDCHGD